MPLIINGATVEADEFAYDGCHKIYLITSADDREQMLGYGYEDMIHGVEDLPSAWEDSCLLRFISYADLSRPNLVNQFDENVTVEYRED